MNDPVASATTRAVAVLVFAIASAGCGCLAATSVSELLQQGDSELERGALTNATLKFRNALAADSNSVPALLKLAGALRQNHEFAEATNVMHSHLAHITPTDELDKVRASLADTHFWWGKELFAQEQYELALTHFRLALDYDESHRRKDAGVDWSEIGSCLYQLDRGQEALSQYEKALPLLVEFQDVDSEATTRGYAGDILREAGRFAEALTHYERRVELLRGLKDVEAEAMTWAKIGNARFALDQFESAIRAYDLALGIFRQRKDQANEATLLENIGDAQRALKHLEIALEYFERCLVVRRELKDQAEQGAMLNKLGAVCEALSRYEPAVEYYRQSLELSRELKDRAGEAVALNNLGSATDSLSRYEEAISYYQKALQLFRDLKDAEDEATCLNNIGAALRALSRYDEALQSFSAALKQRREVSGPESGGAILQNIGLTYDSLSRYEDALRCYEQALPLVRAEQNQAAEMAVLNNLALTHMALGRQDQARELLEQVVTMRRQMHDRNGEATALNNLGQIQDNLGHFEEALAFYRQALEILREVKDRKGESATLNNIGATCFALNRPADALAVFQDVLALKRAIKDRNGEGLALNNMGLALDELGRLGEARNMYELALPILREVKNRNLEANILNNLADIYRQQGNDAQAEQLTSEALTRMRSVKDISGQAHALNNLALIKDSRGQAAEARQLYLQALSLARQAKDPVQEGKTLHNLMLCGDPGENPRLAIFYGKQAVNVIQSIRRQIRGLDADVQRDFLKAKEDTFRALADLLLGQGRLPEAEQVLHLLKEQEYYDFVRRDAGDGSVNLGQADLTPNEAAWEKRYREISGRITALGVERGELLAKAVLAPDESKHLSGLDADIEAANRAFQKQLEDIATEAKSPLSAREEVRGLQEAQGLMETLGELGGRSVAVYTLVGDSKFRLVLITPEVQVAREYPIKAVELSQKVLAFREVLRNPQSDPLPLAQELYSILVGPIARDLHGAKAETLMWSLDGVLRYIPVAALHDGKKYLVESYRNVLFTPASTTRLKDAVSPDWRALGLGVSKAHESFPPLPGVAAELRGIIRPEANASSAILPGAVRLDEDFTAEAMFAALRQKFPLVHIASHFQFRPGNETDSFLLLGDGSHLTLDRIKNLPKVFGGVELLTLSACNTATSGVGADGKEVEGFGVLAQRQGAKAVLASLWPVADTSTRLLMEEFYRLRQARAGTLKAEALRQAQLELLRGTIGRAGPGRGAQLEATATLDPGGGLVKFSHPYYWSPFILIGNWR